MTVSDFPVDHTDLNHLREQWRLAALEHCRLDDAASRLEEGRSIKLAGLVLSYVENGSSVAKAQLEAKVSQDWRTYVRAMHDARRAANDAKIDMQNKDRMYWQQYQSENNQRHEFKMTR